MKVGNEDLFAQADQLYHDGNLDDASAMYQRLRQLYPEHPRVLHAQGVIAFRLGDREQALVLIKRALEIKPDYAEAWDSLGGLYNESGIINEALESYRTAVRIMPGMDSAQSAIFSLLCIQDKFSEAEIHFRELVDVIPQNPNYHRWLGYVYYAQGRVRNALDSFRSALHLAPQDSTIHSHIEYCLIYLPEYTPFDIYSESLRWDRQHSGSVSAQTAPFQVSIVPRSRLRIGYVSPDFRFHAVSFFLEPVVDQHNRDHFEIYCYSDVAKPDDVTTRFMMSADVWIDCTSFTHEELAERIRQDKIDILVDLAGHTRGNRLPVFAKKPAPVQVSWLGYPNTTGLRAMDYRITDDIADPPGDADRVHSEKLIRVQDGFLCYAPPLESPDVSALPARNHGYITFGSLNNLSKITDQVVSVWSEILRRVPSSRLVLKHVSFCDEALGHRTRDRFVVHGISPERIDTLPTTVDFNDHLALYQEIDIALDTFPYNGTTTTCESLWMGVPVVTLRGNRHASRVGASLLSRLGLNDFVAETIVEYVELTVQIASFIDALASLRTSLRERMEKSTLCDAQRFTQNFESELEKMWSRWARHARRGMPRDLLAIEYYNYGLECMQTGNPDEAIGAFRKTLKLRPGFADAYNNLGISTFEIGNLRNVAMYFKKAIAEEPDHANAHNNLGKMLLDTGNYLDAGRYLQKAIDLEHDNPDAWYNLGIASLSRGMLDESHNQFVEAIRLRPDFPLAYNNLGIVLLAKGNTSEAVNAFRQALALLPDYLEAHSNLLLALQNSSETT